MNSCDSFPPFAPFPNGIINSMAVRPQFPHNQPDLNPVFDHESPPMKRRKISSNPQFPNQMNPPVNQPNGKIFFKTRLCIKFINGECKNGENCNFAHGEDDLRKPPPNWKQLIGSKMNNGEDDDIIISRNKLCRKFYNGEECPYGARCNFTHERPPKFREDSSRFRDDGRECSININTIRSSDDQYANANGDAIMRGNSRPAGHRKTKLCNKFEVTGHCPFGDNCCYAHGQAALLLPDDLPTETDQTHYVNPLKSVSAMDIDPIPSKAYVAVAATQSVQSKNGFLKWKPNKKINRIYGDWIDDQPLVLPNEEENRFL